MKRAYVDTSVIVALHFGQTEARRAARLMRDREQALSVVLLVPELLATLQREGRALDEADHLLTRITLFIPSGSLRSECEEALRAGALRGADLWHVAAALAIAGTKRRRDLPFLTFDARQGEVAKKLGFPVPS